MPTNSSSSWACECRRGPCGSTCQARGPRSRAAHPLPVLADVCPQPCAGHRRLRLLRGGHGHLSASLCGCRDGTLNTPNSLYSRNRHPTAHRTLQQLRDAIPSARGYRFLMHDRDTILSQDLDQRVRHLGLRVLKTPVRSPQANALCEWLLGTLRRGYLDFLIPLAEHHLRRLLNGWVSHCNEGRPHMSLGPGIPQPPSSLPVPLQAHRHKIPPDLWVVAHTILGGLHHEYRLEKKAAWR